jgi:AraC-like DNA-binding protein
MKPDYQRAQRMLLQSLRDIAKRCGFTHEVVEFSVILNAMSSAIITELIDRRVLMEPDGIDRVIDFISGQLADHLRRDLTARLRHEEQKARPN